MTHELKNVFKDAVSKLTDKAGFEDDISDNEKSPKRKSKKKSPKGKSVFVTSPG